MEHEMDYTIFQNRLQELIDSRGISRTKLAELAGTTPATISRYLASKREPSLPYVAMLSDFFGVSIDWLLGFRDDKYSDLPEEHQELIHLYSTASVDDRRVIQAVLNKYRNKE